MSTEEDTELRDLVAHTLELNGCLPKIRAELRASIFLALDDDDEVQKTQPLLNTKVKTQLESQEGRTMFCLVREFLEFFNLDFTISVYEPESYLGTSYHYEGRSKIIEDLGISQLQENPALPLLLQLIQVARLKSSPQSKNIDINLSKVHEAIHEEETASPSKSSDGSEVLENSDVSGVYVNGTSSPEARANLNETFVVPKLDLESEKSKDGIKSSEASARLTENGDNTSEEKESPSPADAEFSPPVLKDRQNLKFEALKLSPQKTEKLKTKSSLSSLADLPPLQLNKRNDTVLLPSLYSKEFKEKSANPQLKELEKIFDIDVDSLDNYEEDFMSESDLNINSSEKSASRSRNESDNSKTDATFTKESNGLDSTGSSEISIRSEEANEALNASEN